MLDCLEFEYDQFLTTLHHEQSQSLRDHHDVPDLYDQHSIHIGCAPPLHSYYVAVAAKRVRQDYGVWNSHFKLMKATMGATSLSTPDRKRLARLSLEQALWAAFLKLKTFEQEYPI